MIDALSPLTNLINRLTPRSDDSEEPEFRRMTYQQPEFTPLFSNHEYPATPDQAFNTQESDTHAGEYTVSHDPANLSVNSNDFSASFRVTPISIKTIFINGPKKGHVEVIPSEHSQWEWMVHDPHIDVNNPPEPIEARKESTFIINEKGKEEEYIEWKQEPKGCRDQVNIERVRYNLVHVELETLHGETSVFGFGHLNSSNQIPHDIDELIGSNFNLTDNEIQEVIYRLEIQLNSNHYQNTSLVDQHIRHQMRRERENMERFWYSNDDSNSLNVGNGIYEQISQTNTATYTPAEASDFRRMLEELSNT